MRLAKLNRTWACLYLCGLFALAGCGAKPAANPNAPVQAMTNHGAPVTMAEAEEFTKKLDAALLASDMAALNELIPTEEILLHGVKGLNASDASIQGFIRGMRKSGGMSTQLADVVQSGGVYKLLRIRDVNRRPQPIYRMQTPDGAVNYHEYSLIRYPNGNIGAEDVYIMLMGETFGQFMRRLAIMGMAIDNKSIFASFSPEDQLYVKHQKEIMRVLEGIKSAGPPTGAYQNFRALPVELQKSKAFQVIGLQLAQKVGNDEYLQQMKDYQQFFPDDPSLSLVQIDYFILNNMNQELYDNVVKLETALGGDPYLKLYKAYALYALDKAAEGQKVFADAFAEDSSLQSHLVNYVGLLIMQKKHAAAVQLIKWGEGEKFLELDLANLRENPEASDFVASPEFADLEKWYTEN
ncbi:MAG: hypothetical protein SFX18_05350 [Pirellulales bacterium]|nr:hypothetical protein [Pirellulales bacterium]